MQVRAVLDELDGGSARQAARMGGESRRKRQIDSNTSLNCVDGAFVRGARLAHRSVSIASLSAALRSHQRRARPAGGLGNVSMERDVVTNARLNRPSHSPKCEKSKRRTNLRRTQRALHSSTSVFSQIRSIGRLISASGKTLAVVC